jgi:hypothetical protein
VILVKVAYFNIRVWITLDVMLRIIGPLSLAFFLVAHLATPSFALMDVRSRDGAQLSVTAAPGDGESNNANAIATAGHISCCQDHCGGLFDGFGSENTPQCHSDEAANVPARMTSASLSVSVPPPRPIS